MIVIKRDGSKEPYEPQRIAEAIKKAMRAETGKENEKVALKIQEEKKFYYKSAKDVKRQFTKEDI